MSTTNVPSNPLSNTEISNLKDLYYWLFVCCASVFAIIIVGAITRLTESGLSIVEWKPLIGTIPPLNQTDWNDVFNLYKQTPEYKKVNFWMKLEDFQYIFFWEWFHRLLGRTIGLVYTVPLIYFMYKRKVPKQEILKLWAILALGFLQGFMGWYMVKSGLVNQPAVSHFRLAAHLSLALIIYSCMLWQGLNYYHKANKTSLIGDKTLLRLAQLSFACLCLTILWGAFTAGLDAGLIYNDTFPKMGQRWIPEELDDANTIIYDLLNKHAGVQFAHRWLAITTLFSLVIFFISAIRKKRKEICFKALILMALFQLTLGIATLMTRVSLPIAVLHQSGAVITLTILIVCIYTLKGQNQLRD